MTLWTNGCCNPWGTPKRLCPWAAPTPMPCPWELKHGRPCPMGLFATKLLALSSIWPCPCAFQACTLVTLVTAYHWQTNATQRLRNGKLVFRLSLFVQVNCRDKSDEINCAYLRFGDNYAKELIPRDQEGLTLTVYINVSVLAFPAIETVNLKITADLYLNLRWYDLRITLQVFTTFLQ